MVVIDAEKHKLDYKQSEIDNGISSLKKKYQGTVDEIAAIQKLDPIDLPRTQRREAGSGGHQVVLDLSCRALVQRQLPGL